MVDIAKADDGLPSMMAWRVHEFGPPAVMRFERLPRPEPAAGEVLVKVAAAGVGPWDAWIRAGKSALPQPLPLTPGSDLLPDVSARRQLTATPLNATIEQLQGLPQALVAVAENDVLRDEGEAYARKLSQAGVRVSSVRYNGTIHDFLLLNAISDTPATHAGITAATAALKEALYQANDS